MRGLFLVCRLWMGGVIGLNGQLLDGLRGWRRDLSFFVALLGLPPRVIVFQWRARRLALRVEDRFSVVSATRPRDLTELIGLARGRRHVVELGTGTGWTAISLAITDRKRTVTSYDPIERSERELYLQLIKLSARDRITLVRASGVDVANPPESVDLLYIDSSHSREETIREVTEWRPFLVDDALLVFDDFTHPEYSGVREAITQMGLSGEQCGTLFVHRSMSEKTALAPGATLCARKSSVGLS